MEKERDILRGLELTEEEVKALYRHTTSSMFCELFEDAERMREWLKFCSETEERQGQLMTSPPKTFQPRKMTQDPWYVYASFSHQKYMRSSAKSRLLMFDMIQHKQQRIVWSDVLACEGDAGTRNRHKLLGSF
jgi:hypothetical protein